MGASSPEMFWKWCLQEKMTVSLFFSRNPRKNQNMPWCLKCVGGCKCAMLDLAPLRQAAYCIPPIWRTNVYVNHIYTYILKILRDIHIYIHVFRNMFNASFLHIYIYMVGGVGSPIGRQSGSLNLRKTMFYRRKIEIFDVVHFVLDVFQLRIKKNVRRSWSRRWTMTTCLFLCSFFPHWNYEVHI